MSVLDKFKENNILLCLPFSSPKLVFNLEIALN